MSIIGPTAATRTALGDSVVWWGIWLFAVAAGAWWTVAGPLVMTIFQRARLACRWA